MGVIRGLALAAIGLNPVYRTAERLSAELDVRRQQGMTQCVVSFGQGDIGARNQLNSACRIIVDELQNAGHAVVAVDFPGGGWSSTAHLTVRPRSMPTDPGQAPPVDHDGSAPLRLQRRLADDGSSLWTVHHAGQQMPLSVKQRGLRLGEDPILFSAAWSEVVNIEHPTSFAARVVLADGASYQFGFTTPREGSEFAVDAAQYLQLCRRTDAEPASTSTQAYQIDIDDRSRWIVHYAGRKQPVVVGSEGIRLGENPASFASRWAEIATIEYPTSFAARISLADGAAFQFGFTTPSETADFADCVSSFRH